MRRRGCWCACFFKEKRFFWFDGFRKRAGHDADPNMLLRLLQNIGRSIKAPAPRFIIGPGVTVLYQWYVPGDLMARLFGENEGFDVLMAATIGIPLYMCGGRTIPLLMD